MSKRSSHKKHTELDMTLPGKISLQILERAEDFGACLAGIANVDALKNSPSHLTYGKLDDYKGVGIKPRDEPTPSQVAWSEGARSVIVIAIHHPEEKPELDWWQDGYLGGTLGNQILISINYKLSMWLGKEKEIKTKNLPYYIEQGGVFLKDAAVMAGLGCIGKNNLLVTPQFGPRIRLRAMLTSATLAPTGPTKFDPCLDCSMPCRKTCPQDAFKSKIYSAKKIGFPELPARSGLYSRHLCNLQMELDVANSEETPSQELHAPDRFIRYCRTCEFECPVGKE